MSKVVKVYADKLGVEEAELQAQFDEAKENVRRRKPDASEDELNKRADTLLRLALRRQLSSPAIGFDYVILGYNEMWDIGAYQYKQARDLFESNPERAIELKATNENGEPLDNFGRVAPETNNIQNVFAYGAPKGSPNPQALIFSFTGPRCREVLPLGVALSSRLNLKSADGAYYCNDSVTTELKKSNFPMPGIFTILDTLLPDFQVNLGELAEWHNERSDKRGRIPAGVYLMVEANVLDVVDTPTSRGSYRLSIEDDTMDFMDDAGQVTEGITVWVPGALKDQIQIGNGSVVVIIGQTTAMAGWNRETSEADESVIRHAINALGVFARPESLVPKEEAIVYGREVE